jgi:hypothetical protein
MLINGTSTEQTIDIFISDGVASVIVVTGAWPPPKVGAGRGDGLPDEI